jgi:HK97 family phage major capsid protein
MSAAKDSLNKITTGDLGDGGTLPREMFDEFFRDVQDESVLLDRVRAVPVGSSKTRIPKIGVGERLRQGQDEDTAPSDKENVTTGYVDIDAEKGSVYWDLTRETVEENPEREDLANTILSLMSNQWAVDTEDLGVNGDESGTGFVAQNDGWYQIATARGSPIYHHDDAGDGTGVAQPIDNSMFHQTIQTVDSKYLRADPAFVVNTKQLQEYANNLIGREDGLGAQVLLGDADVNPFGYDIIGTPAMPETEALFTPLQNLIYALRYDVRVEVLSESDDVFDNDLFARYKIVGKDDFQIQDENAVVRIEGLEAVSA